MVYTVSTMEGVSYEKIFTALPIENILWVVFGVTLILFAVFSSVLLWHWKLYSTGKFTTVSNMMLYLGVSAGLLFIMILSILWYGTI